MKDQISRFIKGVATASSAVILGLASLASAHTSVIDTTGPNSNNQITNNSTVTCTVTNSNLIDLLNRTIQTAESGDATVSGNTNGGDAETGAATNSNETDTSVAITNDASICALQNLLNNNNNATIDTTGPNSNNQIRFNTTRTVNVTNRNNVDVDNVTRQTAESGDARVSGNTNGGSASTGRASNAADTSTWAAVTNYTPVAPLGGGSGGGGGSNNATIDTTGPNSNNQIRFNTTRTVNVTNRNNVDVDNVTRQTAESGDARVSGNTNGGDAETGAATNRNEVVTTIRLTN